MGLLGGLGGILGGIVGGIANNDEEEASKQAYIEALRQIQALEMDPTYTNPILLESLQQAGLLTPELAEKLALNADIKNELIENPENKAQQQYALNALKDMSQTGLTAEDRSAFNKLRSQVAADTQAKTNQILQQQQMRGQLSGGDTLASQLASIQGANQQASKNADEIAAQAAAARRSALGQFAGLSGQMREADLGTQKYNMQNELERQRFLDTNSLSRQQQNINTMNAANMANLQRQQAINDANIQARNAELYQQKNRQQTAYQNRAAKAGALSDLYSGQGRRAAQNAANTAQNWTTMGQNVGGLFDEGGEQLKSMFSFGGGGGTSSGQLDGRGPGTYRTAGENFAGGGIVLPNYAHGGEVPKEIDVQSNEQQYGAVPTDSESNDTVPAMLSPGEIVIPKSFAHDKDLSKAYIDFIHKHSDKDKKSKK